MRFTELELPGLFLVELELFQDERGFFARSWCQSEFAKHGLNPQLVQCNISFNDRQGTLRGLHYQSAPHAEDKLVRCTRGRIFDVAVDLRPESPTYLRWFGIELTQDNLRMLYIPKGFAHGFQTFVDQSEVFYQMSQAYHPQSARGVRWDDPAFGINWPSAAQRIISQKDQDYPDFVA
jgi:dTDP-4-dehydrorhamnose 3,5-epimerase